MKLQVKSLSGESQVVEVEAEETVAAVRAAMGVQFKLQPRQIKLLHKSKTLEDGQTIGSYGMSDMDTVVLVALKVR
jgi:hypothetical protein